MPTSTTTNTSAATNSAAAPSTAAKPRAALRIGPSTIHGDGVFATKSFKAGDLIERCPILFVPNEETKKVASTIFGDYVYEWEDGYALALGYGSLYNHSRTSNARYEMDYDTRQLDIVAERRIAAGEEITINYNGDPTDPAPVWFETD
jgi:SET domain-containing protein